MISSGGWGRALSKMAMDIWVGLMYIFNSQVSKDGGCNQRGSESSV